MPCRRIVSACNDVDVSNKERDNLSKTKNKKKNERIKRLQWYHHQFSLLVYWFQDEAAFKRVSNLYIRKASSSKENNSSSNRKDPIY